VDDDAEPRDAFGYTEPHLAWPASIRVGEGKDPHTLAPVVILKIGATADADPIWYMVSLDVADLLADQLRLYAARAREKHWE